MRKLLLVLGMSMLLGACSSARDGMFLGFSTGPNATELQKARSEMQQNALSTVAKNEVNKALSQESKGGLVLIGTVGPLHELDAEDAAKYYEKGYAKSAATWHPDHPAAFVSETDFAQQTAGWVAVEIYSIPGVMTLRMPAQVPSSMVKEIGFPNAFASFLVSKTGDMVAGVSNADGWVYIKKVLCKDSFSEDGGRSYRECAKDYARGRFDASSGRELDAHLTAKKDGVTIDPVSYKRLDSATTASK